MPGRADGDVEARVRGKAPVARERAAVEADVAAAEGVGREVVLRVRAAEERHVEGAGRGGLRTAREELADAVALR